MPIKLILVLALMAFVAVFTGFNLDNSCNIWLFHTFKNVPVFVTILASFAAGVLVTLPFTLGKRVSQVEKEEKQKKLKKLEKEEKKAAREAKKASAKSESAAVTSPAEAVTVCEASAVPDAESAQ